ncbi:MAG: choline dehydrogenase, partial [Alphaproteobacteria bacterium]
MTTPSTAPAATSSEFDYVIVGSGSAGAIMAARLTEDPDIRVAVLEFGGSDRSIFVQMPTALSIPMTQDKFNWGYWS